MRILVIRHESWKTYFLRAAPRRKHRNLGLFEEVLRRRQVPYEYVETPKGVELREPLEAFTHLVVLGARVYRGAHGREIGWHDLAITADGQADRLMSLFPDQARVFQWHDDTFDLPEGCALLPSSERYPHQAFRYGDRACFGGGGESVKVV